MIRKFTAEIISEFSEDLTRFSSGGKDRCLLINPEKSQVMFSFLKGKCNSGEINHKFEISG